MLSELVLVPAPIEEHGSLLTIIKVSNQLVVRWVALSGDLGQLVRSLWKGVEWPVAADDFQPDKRTVEDLFVGPDYYIIPRFQRPYSWDRTNLDEFWRDVIYDNDPGYFIGPMVAWRSPRSSKRRVVDGQQRLTTTAIMFSVIRDELRGLGEGRLGDGIHRYLEKRNRDNEPEYTLQTEADAPYLYRGIFKDPPDRDLEPHSDEEKALHQAAAQVRGLVVDEVKKRRDPVRWLTEVRDKVLGLKVIWVEHSNEDDAYIIFETLNSRGKDLEVVDLLKNLLFNKLRSGGNRQADTVRDQWNTMRGVIEAVGSPMLDVNRFILHWWLSQEDYVAQKKLFRAIKQKVSTKPQAQARLNSLCADVVQYRNALNPSSRTWVLAETNVQRSLEALAEFRVIQPAPLLLSLMRARYGDVAQPLKMSTLIATLQTIERYHFQYTVVSQLGSSGGVSEMYAKAARELYKAATPEKRSAVLKDIREKLVDRCPNRDQFVNDFMTRFLFTSQSTRDARLVRYTLRTLLRTLKPGTSLEDLTIEHILPQDQIGVNGIKAATVGSIGNLMLVSNVLNGKLANKPFTDKRTILAGEGAPYDLGDVVANTSWGPSEIEARAMKLAEVAYDTVWKLPV